MFVVAEATPLTDATIARNIKLQIKPYSIDVAPPSSRMNRAKVFRVRLRRLYPLNLFEALAISTLSTPLQASLTSKQVPKHRP